MTRLGTHIILSTSHLTEDVSQKLTDMGADVDEMRIFGDWRDSSKGLVRCDYGYGHWVRAPNIDPEDPDDSMARRLSEMPECLADCMRHAAQFGARWILFDRDEEAIPNLKQYDW